jgi:hypothetical protein
LLENVPAAGMGSVNAHMWCCIGALLSVFFWKILCKCPILQACLQIAQEDAKSMAAANFAFEQEIKSNAQVSSSHWVLSAGTTFQSLVVTDSHMG